jgi:hypothetical protein
VRVKETWKKAHQRFGIMPDGWPPCHKKRELEPQPNDPYYQDLDVEVLWEPNGDMVHALHIRCGQGEFERLRTSAQNEVVRSDDNGAGRGPAQGRNQFVAREKAREPATPKLLHSDGDFKKFGQVKIGR